MKCIDQKKLHKDNTKPKTPERKLNRNIKTTHIANNKEVSCTILPIRRIGEILLKYKL